MFFLSETKVIFVFLILFVELSSNQHQSSQSINMKTCHSNIIINAPISKVWRILSDTSRYPSWNPLIGSIRGTLKEGKTVLAYVIPLKGFFPVKVIQYEHEKAIVWQGKVLSASLMMGEHYYYLKDLGNNQTELEHGETFTGFLSNFAPDAVVQKMQESYDYHNQKLKIIAELGS